MGSIKINKRLADFVKEIRDSDFWVGIQHKSIKGIMAEAVKVFCNKSKKCLSCPLHRDQIAGIEMGRQMLALKSIKEGKAPSLDGTWIKTDKETSELATRYAKAYRSTVKTVLEQALVEFLTKPKQCGSCVEEKDG